MSDAALYVLNGISLRVYPKAYLVEVRPLEDKAQEESLLSDLPEWVFRSRKAIWVTLENGSMLNRAERGERIKKDLITSLSLENTTQSSSRNPAFRTRVPGIDYAV